jgi:glycosyltransferase involved in cell wall biosynthesis
MRSSLKIVVVSTSDTAGGAARAAYRIMQGVQNTGKIAVRMLVKNKYANDKEVIPLSEFIPQNFIFKAVDWVVKKIKNKIQHCKWNKYPNRENVYLSDLRSTSLHGALHKLDFDVLHLHWVNLRFLNLAVLHKIEKPIVWTLHDAWAFTGICHYFYACEKYKTQCGDCPFLHSGNEYDLSYNVWKKKKKHYEGLNLHVVTPSRWLAGCAKQSSLFKNFPVTVIPNCIDTDIYKPLQKEKIVQKMNLPLGKKRILFGAMGATSDVNKGFEQLLCALQLLEKQHGGAEYELFIFGADEPIEELAIEIPVHYFGVLSDEKIIVELYNVADVMVVPSLSENLSNTIMESLACGTPVVAFDIGGNADMVDYKKNGYLAAPFLAEELTAGIVWCVENNTDGQLSLNARKKVMNNYTIEKVSREYEKLYKIL